MYCLFDINKSCNQTAQDMIKCPAGIENILKSPCNARKTDTKSQYRYAITSDSTFSNYFISAFEKDGTPVASIAIEEIDRLINQELQNRSIMNEIRKHK